jgi:hypothetical protein
MRAFATPTGTLFDFHPQGRTFHWLGHACVAQGLRGLLALLCGSVGWATYLHFDLTRFVNSGR